MPVVESYGEIMPDDFVKGLNARINRRNYALSAGLAISATLLALSVPWPLIAIVGPAVFVLVHLRHRRRHSTLTYGDEKEIANRLENLHKGVSALHSSEYIWSIGDSAFSSALPPHPSALNRTRISVGPLPLPEFLRTNITPAALQLSNRTLYFFPDRLFVWNGGDFSAINYSVVKVRFKRLVFIERDQLPSDAALEGQIRRSFGDIATVPRVYYGVVEFDAPPILRARLMTSRVENAEIFVSRLSALASDLGAPEPLNESLYTHSEPNRVPLFYCLTDSGFDQLRALRDAFALIARCGCVWRYNDKERTDDWKRNAGAGTLVTRRRIYPKVVDHIPGYESNAVVGLSVDNSTLYLLPDGLVIQTGNHFARAGTKINIKTSTTNFREEEGVPRDADVIGHTWRYVTKNGGPDLRFNGNRQIPICRYGHVDIEVGSWRLYLCLSQGDTAAKFEDAFLAALRKEPKPDGGPDSADEPKPAMAPSGIADALSMLGLASGATFEEASVAYRSLAAQNHPDKVAHMAMEFRELAERRMRELNAAYDQVRLYFRRS